LTATLYFSGKVPKGKCCVFSIDFFSPLLFDDGDQVDFCQFKKAGLNMLTEILIPWAGVCSSRAATGRELTGHVLTLLIAHVSFLETSCCQVIFGDQEV